MFSKLLRKILVIAFQIIVLGTVIGASALAKSPDGEALRVFQIEQIRANMPQIQVYVQGAPEGEFSCEAYLDGVPLTDAGTESLEENGTSYLIMLDVSGSIRPDYFISVKEQLLNLAQDLKKEKKEDCLTLITFGDSVKMQVSGCRDPDELTRILNPLQARDQKTRLYEAFKQCLKYAESTAQKERQIVLVISDGMQDTGSIGITQKEIEDQLLQVSMPVYAFCVDTAEEKAQEEFGRFARTTGGSFAVFNPETVEETFQNWQADLAKTQVLCFKSDTNYADGELHTVLLKTLCNGKAQSDTRQIRLLNWVADTTPPEVTSFAYDEKQGIVELQFSEPVLGAEDLNAYELRKNGNIKKIERVTSKGTQQYQLVLPDDLAFGTYTLSISNVYDDSMEKNPLNADTFTFHKSVSWRDVRPFVIAVFIVATGCAGAVLWWSRRKNKTLQPTEPQKIEYEVQHVVTTPKASAPSPTSSLQSAKMVLEVVGGVEAGQRFETAVHKSAIWGRSKEMCDVSFEDHRISRQHCVFEVEEQKLLLSDLNSQNGTYLNGIRIQGKVLLHCGDMIQIGDTVLKVVSVWM